ncbi:chalcone isomerase family protein [Pseudidiomarina aquimaris]|uniref:chalcone isomerase family protein n=1 Tax=Pseudidiomarina aquimaris TaxID=641841 RepID=UPI003A974DBE
MPNRHNRKRLKRWVTGLALCCVAAPTMALACEPDSAQDLQAVGKTRLSVWFWDVYDAQLLTDSGNYDDYDRRALRLSYLRDIKAKDLVETTKEEWQRMDIAVTSEHEQWLEKLQEMWPDVSNGDCLMLVETEQGHSSFYNAEGRLGGIDSAQFTDDFLAIWLSPNSRFKDERNELIGAK